VITGSAPVRTETRERVERAMRELLYVPPGSPQSRDVGVDERAAGQIATQHLLDLGHRRIGFVAGPERFMPTREKAAGRELALAIAGVAPDGLVVHGDCASRRTSRSSASTAMTRRTGRTRR
jgi:DNA-binding LacI/PurR family transcriptional regulator